MFFPDGELNRDTRFGAENLEAFKSSIFRLRGRIRPSEEGYWIRAGQRFFSSGKEN